MKETAKEEMAWRRPGTGDGCFERRGSNSPDAAPTVGGDDIRQQHIAQLTEMWQQVNWLGRRHFSDTLSQHGLTFSQFVVLAHLCRCREGCAIHEIADATLQERATMTGILDRLERAGWVARARSPDDRRRWIITLTPAGQALMEETMRRRHLWFSNALQGFALDELEQFHRLLDKFMAALRPAGDEHPT